jgi:putative metalloprotease
MKLQYTLSALALATLVSGCQNMSADSMLNTGLQAFQAVTLSDADVKKMSDEACAQMDSEAKIAPASSKYSQRLKKIATNLGSDAGGTPVNYKVYLTNDVNAWAMANGCVRVYSGLMDLMNDNEVEGVLGHEMGHVALGHSKKAMQTAYATSIARDAAASSGNGAVAALSSSQLGALGEALVNAQFSQSQESDADDFSFDLMKKRGLRLEGLASAFDKLAKLGGGDSSMFDSHPGSADRAAHIRQRIAAGK